MNRIPTAYALRMTADLRDTDDGKFETLDHDEFPNNRAWYRSVDGKPFELYISDSNSQAPTLIYYFENPDASDTVRFEIYFIGATLAEISHPKVIASFGAKRDSGTRRSTPFRQPNGNAMTILGLDGANPILDKDAYFIGPYQPRLFGITPIGPPPPKETYEFSLVASFTKTVGAKSGVVQFGYDPEMDIEPQTGP